MDHVSLSQSHYPATPALPPEITTIGGLLRDRAARWPDTLALEEIAPDGEPARRWSYAELLADAERLGRALASRHAPGARVAVYANNLPEWILMEFATALAGVVLVTVNPSFQKRELKYQLEQSRAEAVYCVEAFRGNPLRAIAGEAVAELATPVPVILLTDRATLYAGENRGELPEVRPDDIAQIQYTSGTTGFPKGALLRHHGLVRNAIAFLERAGVRQGDTFVHVMPMFHTAGCGTNTLGGIAMGTTIRFPPLFDPAMVARVIERVRPRFLLAVPTMVVALLDETARNGRDLSSMERIICGGAIVSPDLIGRARELIGAQILVVYGQTETSLGIAFASPDDAPDDLLHTAGRPFPDIEVAILDPQTGAVQPVGQQGEICTRGYHLMAGYNDNPEATAKTIDAEGWLHTGDLGRMDARGYVSITGRVKEMIIRGGENLFPAEIENAILEHADVGEAAVVGVPCPEFGEQVACFMRASNGRKPGTAELRAFIRERLSPQKTPKYWLWVEAWPLTGSGKIQKFRLAEQFVAGEHLPA